MNNQERLKSKKNIIVVIVISFAALIIVCLAMWSKMQKIIDEQLEQHVADQGRLLSGVINNSFNDELRLLGDATVFINSEDGTPEKMFSEEEGISYGVLRINGEATYGETLSLQDYEGLFDALHGNPSVCCKDGKVLFAVPVYKGANVKYVLYKLYENEVLARKLNFTFYDGMGDCVLTDIDGMIILKDENSRLEQTFFERREILMAYEREDECKLLCGGTGRE